MIRSLKSNEVFVFGSNLAGRHGKGAALMAARKFGAERGVGSGPTGQCYAIPTKDQHIKTLPLEQIQISVRIFINYAAHHLENTFLLTRIGCGLAGYKDEQIAPMFKGISPNVIPPKEWTKFLK